MSQSPYVSGLYSPPSIPDMASIADSLQQAARALLELNQGGQPSGESAGSRSGLNQSEPKKTLTEYRTYRVPGFIVDEEQRMLRLYNSDSWQEMLNKTYEQLYTMALLMKGFEAEEHVDGFSVQLMGNTMMAPLGMLSRLCSLVADFRLQSEDE